MILGFQPENLTPTPQKKTIYWYRLIEYSS